MPPNDHDQLPKLAEAIAEVVERITQHGAYLRLHEARTRTLLIDELLAPLGWELTDPDSVHIEFQASSGRPDYALMRNDKPVAIIEAKKLGTNLNSIGPGQILKYATDPSCEGLQRVAITNGDDWRIYDREENWSDKSVKLSRTHAFESGHVLITKLSRSNFQAEDKPSEPTSQPKPISPGPPPVPPSTPTSPPMPYTPLGNLEDEKGRRRKGRVTFPDGSTAEFDGWQGLYFEVAKYLVRNGDLHPGMAPFGFTKGTRYAVSPNPFHREGKSFDSPREIGDGMVLEAYTGSGAKTLHFTKLLVEKCGGDTSQYLVTLTT